MNLDDFLENDERREVQLLQLLLKAGAAGCLYTTAITTPTRRSTSAAD